jgi:type II secretory pathway pseudopilin PulG
MRRGQVFIFVFLLMMIVGILAAGVAITWQAKTQVQALQRQSLIAFYLAQAGIERGKIEVLYGYWSAGTYNINNQNDLDLAGDNYQFFYDIVIVNPMPGGGGTTRRLTATGRVLDLAGNEIACRQIQVDVSGIQDLVNNGTGLPPPDGIDDNLSGSIGAWTWREI